MAKWKIGIYLRLSKDDGNEISNSVKNQEMRIISYLSDFEEDYEVLNTYVDDGFTGTDTDRENFKLMIRHICEQKINCVIVKDLSRFSRNIADASYYLENLFVEYNVRFISLELPALDSYRHPEQMNSILVPMQNLINDDFCRQTSVKIRSVLNAKRKRGEFIGAFAPYGYKKDPENKNRLIIDEEAAIVVQDIFKWYVLEGLSKTAIAKKLNQYLIPNPSAYKRLKGYKYAPSKTSGSLWSPKTISHILNNQMYLGHMVQGKYRILSHKVHKQINTSENEWIIVKNTHDPIVSSKLFYSANQIQNLNIKQPENSTAINTLSGFLYCSDCGHKMVRSQGGSTKKFSYYICRTYKEKNNILCTKHSIRADRTEQILLTILNLHLKLPQFTEEYKKIILSKNTGKIEKLNKILTANYKELEKIQNTLGYLYMDWRNNEISYSEYTNLKSTLTEKNTQIVHGIQTIKDEIVDTKNDIANNEVSQFIQEKNFKSLNRPIMSVFIDKIIIYENNRIKINLNYRNPF